MGCGCKKRKKIQPTQEPAKVVLKETVSTPQQNDVEKIVSKLNEILTP